MADDNKTLGRFMLDGIPSAPRGIPQIEVSFDIDANGILNVSAKDKATGKSQSIRIEGSSGLSQEEIEKMKKDAEMHAGEDKKKRELIESKNLADNLIFTTEKTLKEAGDKIVKEKKKEVEDKVAELKKAKESDKIEEIKQKTQELSQVIQQVGSEMYKAAQEAQQKQAGQQQDGPAGSEQAKEEKKAQDDNKPEEGEYEERNDK